MKPLSPSEDSWTLTHTHELPHWHGTDPPPRPPPQPSPAQPPPPLHSLSLIDSSDAFCFFIFYFWVYFLGRLQLNLSDTLTRTTCRKEIQVPPALLWGRTQRGRRTLGPFVPPSFLPQFPPPFSSLVLSFFFCFHLLILYSVFLLQVDLCLLPVLQCVKMNGFTVTCLFWGRRAAASAVSVRLLDSVSAAAAASSSWCPAAPECRELSWGGGQ